MAYEIVRSPEIIAAEINTIKSQTASVLASAYKQAQNSIFEIGRRLCEVKEMVGHGNWATWLAENVDYSESTANNLMRIFREMGSGQVDLISGKSDAEIFDGLSQSQLVELFPIPKEERAAFVEEHREQIEDASVRELRDMVKAYEELKARASQLEETIERSDREYDELLAEKKQLEEERSSLDEQLAAARKDAEQMRLDLGEKMSAVPSEEEAAAMVEDIRAQVRESMDKEWQTKEKEIRDKILAEAKEKHKKELDKLKADAAKEKEALEQIRAESEAQALREIAALKKQNDVHVQKVNFALNALGRDLTDIQDELNAMEAEEPGSGVKLRAKCEAALGRLLSSVGWSV